MSIPVVIHPNPAGCTLRHGPGIIRAAGHAPTVIGYLAKGGTRPPRLALFAAADSTWRQALRLARPPAPDITDDQLPAAMTAHPILADRPTVCTPKDVRPCRPSEVMQDLPERTPPRAFAREEGQRIFNAEGNRLV